MPSRRRSSRVGYREFVHGYKHGGLDVPPSTGAPGTPSTAAPGTPPPAGGRQPTRFSAYLRWLRPHRRSLGVVLTLAIVSAFLQMLEPLFIRYILDDVLLARDTDAAGRLARLNRVGGVFLGVILLTKLLDLQKDYRQRLLNVRVMLSLRRASFRRLLHLPLPALWEMKTGGILSRLTGDIDTTTGLLQMAVVSPSVAVVRLVVAVGILLTLNWRLALSALAIIPGVMLLSLAFAKRVRPIYRSVRGDAERIDGRVGETFSGIRVVRAFRRERRELHDYVSGRHGVLRKELFAQRRELALWTSWNLLLAIVNLVILWYGGYLNISSGASVGDIVAFQWYAFLLLNPVWQLVNTFSETQRGIAAMDRVFEVLAMPSDKPDRPDARDAPAHVREIAFEEVEFEYRPGQPVVHDFSVVVPGGTVVAIVGRSGAGKTTVTDLVARLHDPTRGRILLNGSDLREFRLSTYRDLLGIVQQDVFLFDGSIRDNIEYGAPGATDVEIEDAARRANVHEFVARLPQQYETLIGERGVKLSGGQRQRLAIARAMLKAPQILILDEATSNLDTESEQLIQASLVELLAGRTTFVIAHRLSTIRRADMILLMEAGRIIERGTHEELMHRCGVYHSMVRDQIDASVSRGEPWRWRTAVPTLEVPS